MQGSIPVEPVQQYDFGAEAAYTRIKPFESKVDSTLTIDPGAFQSFTPLPFREYTLYAESEMNIGAHFLLRPGIHLSAYRLFEILGENGIHLAFRIGNRINSLPLRNKFLIQRLDIRGDEPFLLFRISLAFGRKLFGLPGLIRACLGCRHSA
ncbi:MAG TPA: hypothetical protein VNS58_21295 [Puia sp.]|nr:hypothetical protein [Puia sp.]